MILAVKIAQYGHLLMLLVFHAVGHHVVLVTRAGWVNFELSIKCVGASCSFPIPLCCLNHALLIYTMHISFSEINSGEY